MSSPNLAGSVQVRPRQPRLRCALCKEAFRREPKRSATCLGCGVVYHRACQRELGGCPTLGCTRQTKSLQPARARPELEIRLPVQAATSLVGLLAFIAVFCVGAFLSITLLLEAPEPGFLVALIWAALCFGMLRSWTWQAVGEEVVTLRNDKLHLQRLVQNLPLWGRSRTIAAWSITSVVVLQPPRWKLLEPLEPPPRLRVWTMSGPHELGYGLSEAEARRLAGTLGDQLRVPVRYETL